MCSNALLNFLFFLGLFCPNDNTQGTLDLVNKRQKILEDITAQKAIIYRIKFPTWRNFPPRLTRIRVNRREICSGPEIPITMAHKISLHNFLDFSPSSPMETQHKHVIIDEIIDSNNAKFRGLFGVNKFHFNPKPPEKGVGQIHRIRFRPRGKNNAKPVNKTPPPPTYDYYDETFESPSRSRKIKLTSRNPSEICGQPIITNSLMVHGETTSQGEFPWLVALYEVHAIGIMYKCCANLISKKHVVTAAHCVFNDRKRYQPHELVLRLGKPNIHEWSPNGDEQMLVANTVDVHPDYRHLSADADIAVITLGKFLEFSKLIQPICLWTNPSDVGLIVGRQGVVAGWGKDEFGQPSTALPKQTALPIVSRRQCLKSAYQYAHITSDRTLCAGYRNGSGPCNGDSGSGLLLKIDDRWTLRGIVSMSIATPGVVTCDLSNYVVFTDASKFTDWLLSFVEE